MARIHYREQDLQIRCVKWFRVTYPAFACLMFHPKNEEAGGRARAAIAKAEGVQAGSMDGALKAINEVMGGTMIDYVTCKISETTIMDVFEYLKKDGKKEDK